MEEIINEQKEFEEIMGLYGQYFYEEQGIYALSAVETIYKLWKDIGRNRMKISKGNMIEEMEARFLYHLFEEIIPMNEKSIVVEGCNAAELKGKRMKTLYDYLFLESETY
jgi:hypothetical protein